MPYPARPIDPGQRQRIRTGLGLYLVAIVAFSLGEIALLGFHPVPQLLRVGEALLTVWGIRWLRPERGRDASMRVTLAIVSTFVVATAVEGTLVGDPEGTPVLLVAICAGAAAMVSWGPARQAILATVALLAALGNRLAIGATPGMGALALAVPTVLAVTVSTAWLLARWDRDRLRAEAAEAELRERRHGEEVSRAARLTTLGGMAAGLAHEIDQPLGAIVSYARGMGRRVRAGDAPPAELAAVADAIAEQEMRAAEVLRRIRGFLRQTEVPRTAVDLSGVVDEAVRLAAGEARETGVHLVCDRTGAPLLVQADPVQLVQVLLNLLRNAFAAVGANAPGARDVGVRVQRLADGRAEVAVHDAGPGVPAEIAQRLFEPFTTTRRDGLGLGLAISRAIVEAHGGRMWSAPNSPRGAVFAFSLPLVGGAVDAA